MHPWKPRYATAVSSLQIVAAASLLHSSKVEQEIHVYKRQITEVEIHETIDSGEYGQGIGLALMMLGTLMIITSICALCVQAKKRWRQVTSQGESRQAATEGALRAAPQASEAYHQTSAAESALRAALQARPQKADPEPNPQETRKQGTSRSSQDTAHPKVNERGSSSRLEPTKVYYSKDGLKTGLFHINRHCSHLKAAKEVHERPFDYSKNFRKHRFCESCEHAKMA